MALKIVEKVALTDVGRQRHANEDSFFESAPVFAVADGMGGAQAGEVASRIAVGAFEGFSAAADGSAEAQLAEVARGANRRIWEMAQEDESRAGMGTTLTAAMVVGGDVSIGHVGDSRFYRLRDGELERLTNDHSLVEEMVRQGRLSPEGAENHPQRSIITRALGPEPDVEVETCTYSARSGDVYLICSDGLTGMVSDGGVASILTESSSLEAAARALVDAANENGGRDNITVVLFRLDSEESSSEDDPDTLTGLEHGGAAVRTADVRAAVASEGADPPDISAAARRAPIEGATITIDAETAAAARAAHAAGAAPDAVKIESDAPSAAAPRRSRHRRARRTFRALLALALVAVVVAGTYAGARRLYFVGTDDRGLISLYRGLPYELPLGLETYGIEYTSTVPARSLPPLQRRRVLDHQLRGREDAVDLVRELERLRRRG